MIKITDKPNKVIIDSTSYAFMPSIIFKSQVSEISHNEEKDFIIIRITGRVLQISYIYIDPVQRDALGINSNADLFEYFNSITD